jgi:hypothetical protein
LSWLAEATKPVTGDCAKAAICPSWACTVILWLSVTLHSSNDYVQQIRTLVNDYVQQIRTLVNDYVQQIRTLVLNLNKLFHHEEIMSKQHIKNKKINKLCQNTTSLGNRWYGVSIFTPTYILHHIKLIVSIFPCSKNALYLMSKNK